MPYRVRQLNEVRGCQFGKEDGINLRNQAPFVNEGACERCDNGYHNGCSDPTKRRNLEIQGSLFPSFCSVCLQFCKRLCKQWKDAIENWLERKELCQDN
jgi:uncharacterized protein YggL (DUF469 family)